MSTSKLDASGVFAPITVQTPQKRLTLSPQAVVIRKNGVEFLTEDPLPLWAEVTVDLRSPVDARPFRGSGVVVQCTGTRHTGYVVSLVFMNLTRQSQARLTHLAETEAV